MPPTCSNMYGIKNHRIQIQPILERDRQLDSLMPRQGAPITRTDKKKPRYLFNSGVFNAYKGLTGGLGRNRKTRPGPRQSLL